MKSRNAIKAEIQHLREMSQDTLENIEADKVDGVAITSMCLGAAYALGWLMSGPPPSTMIQREATKRQKRSPAKPQSDDE